jgi:hypothetical protein
MAPSWKDALGKALYCGLPFQAREAGPFPVAPCRQAARGTAVNSASSFAVRYAAFVLAFTLAGFFAAVLFAAALFFAFAFGFFAAALTGG